MTAPLDLDALERLVHDCDSDIGRGTMSALICELRAARERIAVLERPGTQSCTLCENYARERDEARVDRDMWKANALRVEKERDEALARAVGLEA